MAWGVVPVDGGTISVELNDRSRRKRLGAPSLTRVFPRGHDDKMRALHWLALLNTAEAHIGHVNVSTSIAVVLSLDSETDMSMLELMHQADVR